MIISKPGVYDITEQDYHQDPVPGGSLSCSGSKLLLPPKCPAVYEWTRKNGRKPTRAMEFGTAAHREVLGRGWPIDVFDGKDWKSKAAQDFAEASRKAGRVPILAKDREQITAMAAVLRAHPVASMLIDPDESWLERSYFWQDEETGVMLRARMDAFRVAGRPAVVDYKSSFTADPDEFAKAAGRLGYHMQAAHYLEAIRHILGDADPFFLFLVQEKDPPHEVAVYELDGESLWAGADRNQRARRIYARCVAANEWPGYQPGEQLVTTISVPRWAR